MRTDKNIWLDGIMGVAAGDALGCPVQFESREEVAEHPVTGMRGYGTFNLPEGSWTDDTSLTLALAESIFRKGTVNYDDIMGNFMDWLYGGKFTPFGYSFDIGRGTMCAIDDYRDHGDFGSCGGRSDHDNGNGSLMRILPACIFAALQSRGTGGEGDPASPGSAGAEGSPASPGRAVAEGSPAAAISEAEAVEMVHTVSALTHAHLRSRIACGLYFFMVREILENARGAERAALPETLAAGLAKGFAFYESSPAAENIQKELNFYVRLRDTRAFAAVPAAEIRSSGYVVDTLEAAVWSLLTTDTFADALLTAVNLGDDTDSVAAVTGGLAGLYYGYENIPQDWLAVIQRREWIEELCRKPAVRE